MIVYLPRVLGQVRISSHHVRRKTADSLCFRSKFQIAEIAVGRAAIGNKNRVVKIKNDRHTSLVDQLLKYRRAKQCSLAQDVDQVIVLDFSHEREPATQAARHELHFLSYHPGLVNK